MTLQTQDTNPPAAAEPEQPPESAETPDACPPESTADSQTLNVETPETDLLTAAEPESSPEQPPESTPEQLPERPTPEPPPVSTPVRPRPRIAAPPQPHEGGWLRAGLQRSDLVGELNRQTPATPTAASSNPPPATPTNPATQTDPASPTAASNPPPAAPPPPASAATASAATASAATASAGTDPQLPPQAQSDVALARQEGRGVFFRNARDTCTASIPCTTCPNCGGLGAVIVQIVLSGPYKSPSGHGPVTWIDGSWFAVQTRSYPCPCCQDPALRLAELWRACGLELAERDWTLDFLHGMPGKEIAVESARALLSQCPTPHGWLTYYGGYGAGKSGLLKSIVAACIRLGVSAHYTRAEDILQSLRASYDDEAPSEASQLERYAAFQVLAIDEIDRTSGTAWARATLLTLLDGRYNRRSVQATLLASNVPPEGMPRDLGYLASRMKDGERVLVGGREMRGR